MEDVDESHVRSTQWWRLKNHRRQIPVAASRLIDSITSSIIKYQPSIVKAFSLYPVKCHQCPSLGESRSAAMSQEYFVPDEGSHSGEGRSSQSPPKTTAHTHRTEDPMLAASTRPQYMTVGSGSTSAAAAALTAMLDSGYGDSLSGDGSSEHGWQSGLKADMPTPPHVPVLPGEINAASENEKRVLASHVHQLF